MTLYAHYNKGNFEGFYLHTPSDEHYKLRAIHSLGNIDMETRNQVITYDNLMARLQDPEPIGRYSAKLEFEEMVARLFGYHIGSRKLRRAATITSKRVSGELLFICMIDLAMRQEVSMIELPGLVFTAKETRKKLNQRYIEEYDPKMRFKRDPNHQQNDTHCYGAFESRVITVIKTECFGYFTVDEETKEIDIHAGRAFFPRWTYTEQEYENTFSTSLKADLDITVTIVNKAPYKPIDIDLYGHSFRNRR